MSGVHARLSPSGSKKWMACPGSLTLEAQMHTPDFNEFSDSGTAMHTVAAKVLMLEASTEDFLGHPVVVSDEDEEERTVIFTEEMAELVDGYVEAVTAIVAKPTELVLVDLKTGYKWVEVENNSQLMTYALGALASNLAPGLHVEQLVDFSTAVDVEGQFGTADVIIMPSENVETVRLCIYAPRHDGMHEWSCTIEDLTKFESKLWDRAQLVELARERWDRNVLAAAAPRTSDNDQVAIWNKQFLNPNPNEDECAFCRAMPTCPAMRAKVAKELSIDDFGAVEEPFSDVARRVMGLPTTVAAPALPALTPPTDYDAARLGRVMSFVGTLEDFGKSVRAEVERRLLLGEEVPGWGLELGRQGNRAWKDPAEVERLLRKQYRIKIEDAFKLKLISPTDAEKLAKKGTLTDLRWQHLQTLVERSAPVPSVKPSHVIKVAYMPPEIALDGFEAIEETKPDAEVL